MSAVACTGVIYPVLASSEDPFHCPACLLSILNSIKIISSLHEIFVGKSFAKAECVEASKLAPSAWCID